jgi:hypothetical protein
MLPKPVWIVAFSAACENSESVSGPSAANLPATPDRIRQAILEFQRAAREAGGEIELFLGVSHAFDQMTIEIAESLGLMVHIIVPLPVPELAEDFRDRPRAWDLAVAAIAKSGGLLELDQASLNEVLSQGDRKFPAAEWPPKRVAGWTFRVSHGSHHRPDCYHDCGAELIQAADALVVVPDQRNHGAANITVSVIEQGRARGIAIAQVAFDATAILRIEWGPEPWRADPVMEKIGAALNPVTSNRRGADRIENVFSSLDSVASRIGGRLKNRVTLVIVLQFVATLLATINAALLQPKVGINPFKSGFEWNITALVSQVLFFTGLILVSTAFVLGWTSRRTKLKSRWRLTRFGAEIVRGLIYTRGFVDPLQPVISGHDPAWHRLALSSGLLAERGRSLQALDWETEKANYIRQRVDVQREAYFQKLHSGASRISAACGTVAIWAGSLAPFCLVLALYLKFAHEEWVASSGWSPVLVTFLPVLLPLLAGTSTSLRVVTDAGRRAERYAVMAQRLLALGRWLPTLKTPVAIRRAVVNAETILLDELIEWHAASRAADK